MSIDKIVDYAPNEEIIIPKDVEIISPQYTPLVPKPSYGIGKRVLYVLTLASLLASFGCATTTGQVGGQVGAGLVGAGIGFAVGGPPGAAIGAGIGASGIALGAADEIF